MKAILLQLVAITLCVVNYAPAMAKDPPGVNPQHFQCYSAQEKEPGKHEVTLKDQFEATEPVVAQAALLCNPVSKNREPVRDYKTHLVCYRIMGGKPVEKQIKIQNQFGTSALTVKGPNELLCVPSLKFD